jgi:Zn finger protein HypA/HybF involved in hydrogenase expression
MATNLDYEIAHLAIEDYKAGLYPDVVAAANARGANIQVVNLMVGNESVITEDTFVSEVVRLERTTICNSCDQLFPENNGTCNQCACPISMLVNMEFKSCPLGKW